MERLLVWLMAIARTLEKIEALLQEQQKERAKP
jgi:hypothetical protein